MAATKYGKSGWASGFSNGVKVRAYAESNTAEIEIVGEFNSITQPKTGQWLKAEYADYLPPLDSGLSWAVQNSTLTGEEAGMATLHVSCIGVNSLSGAYDISWDVDMREVQRSIKQHPKVLGDSTALSIIQLWEQTPEAIRYDGAHFYYYAVSGGVQASTLTQVSDNSVAYDCLAAIISGIETYNVYLPVVTKTSRYIAPMVSNRFPYDKKIGRYDHPTVCPAGYAGGHKWFKSGDKYSRANNGTWTRTEEWTYTDDTTHSWIYSSSS